MAQRDLFYIFAPNFRKKRLDFDQTKNIPYETDHFISHTDSVSKLREKNFGNKLDKSVINLVREAV